VTKIGLMAAAALSLSAGVALAEGMRRDLRTGLVHDKDGFVSEADREASLFLAGHEVRLSPAAREIVERRLRQEGGPKFSGYSMPAPRGTAYKLDADIDYAFNHGPQKAKPKFKHNRRG
jgi:hypothetical protein